MKSVKPKAAEDGPADPSDDAGRGRHAEVAFRGLRRTKETHASTTDPDARLCCKSPGVGAAVCFMGQALMENSNGLIVDAELTRATGTAERVAALAMLEGVARDAGRRITLAACRAYHVADLLMEAREPNVTPHAAQNTAGRRSAIDGRTLPPRSDHPPRRRRHRPAAQRAPRTRRLGKPAPSGPTALHSTP